MKFLKWISKLFGERTELKISSADNEKQNIISILHSDYKWRKYRNEYIFHNPRCEMCLETKDLEVHHIKPWHIDIDGRYDKTNLIVLCRYCHFRFGHWRNWKKSNRDIIDLTGYVQKKRYLNDIS